MGMHVCLRVCVCVCTTGAAGTYGDQNTVSDPLELEVKMVVSYFCGCWEQILALCNSN